MLDTELIDWIKSKPGITPLQVSERLGVSVRTVRDRIARANHAMEGFARVELKRGAGYRILVDDRPAFEAWIKRADLLVADAVPQTSDERIAFLLCDLLSRTDWVTLDVLSESLYISRWSVSHDLHEVECRLHEFGLHLEKRPRYGIRVVGSEMSRRAALADVVMDSHAKVSEFTASNISIFSKDTYEMVRRCVDEALEQTSFQVNSMAYQNLLVHICVAVSRMKNGCNLAMSMDNIQLVQNRQGYKTARLISEKIEAASNCALPVEETAYITIHLAGKQAVALDGSGEHPVITDEIWAVADAMIERVWHSFRFDFRGDLTLSMSLAQHVAPLVVRLKYRLGLRNPLLSDIRTRYPLAYSMATEAAVVLTERFEAIPSEDEIGYIALSFALALEQDEGELPKKTLLVVCGSGAGSARLLAHRCQREFGDYIDKIMTCDAMEVVHQDFASIDYVFTTVPLVCPVPVPVREVSYFLNESEVMDARDFLRSGIRDRSANFSYFDPRLFFTGLPFESKQETIDFLVEQTQAIREVQSDFRDSIWQRERLMSTAFGNLVGMPHPIEADGPESFAAVALLKNPVIWDEGGERVQVVIMLVLARDAGKNLQDFYSILADMVMDGNAMRQLAEVQRWKTLEDLFDKFSRV